MPETVRAKLIQDVVGYYARQPEAPSLPHNMDIPEFWAVASAARMKRNGILDGLCLVVPGFRFAASELRSVEIFHAP